MCLLGMAGFRIFYVVLLVGSNNRRKYMVDW
jgi:hypothetical protein